MRLRRASMGLAVLFLLAWLAAGAAAVEYAGNDRDTVLGVSGGAMSPRRTSVSYGSRVEETALGDFVADALRVETGAAVAVVCGGHLKESLPGGELTKTSVYAVFEEDHTVGVAELPVSLFFEVLEHAVGQTAIDEAERIDPNSGFDGFPQVSGFRFTYDVSQPTGERVREVTLDDGRSLSATDQGTVTLAAPGDLLRGELGFTMLRGTAYSEVGTQAELLAAYIASRPGEISRPDTGRIQVVGTADNSIYRSLGIGKFLPYMILIALLVTLPRQKNRERNMDGTFTRRPAKAP